MMSEQGQYGRNAKSNREIKGDNLELKILKDIPPWEWPEDAARIFLGVLRDDQTDESDFVILEFAGLYNAGLKLGADMF